jgi:tetratricopeptide (TPR) repeat protein
MRRIEVLRIALVFVLALLPAFAGPPILAQGHGGTMDDFLVRGEALLVQKRPNEAIVQFQAVRTFCPNPVLIVTSFVGEAKARMELREYLPAAGLLEEAATSYPDDPRLADMLYMAGFARQQAGDHLGSVPLLRQSLEHDPPRDILPAVKLRLARGLRRSGEASEAVSVLADFETSFPGNPQIPNALYTLAITQHDAGLLDDSEATYRRLIDGFPGSPAAIEAHFDLGLVLGEAGKTDEAVQFYRDFVSLEPNSPFAAKALERAADLLLFRSPGQSAQFYGLAVSKAETNPLPPVAMHRIGRWLGLKRTVANLLSRTWAVLLLALLLIGGAAGAVMLARRLVRRRRSAGQASA